MTLEDFFTLTEINNGLTDPARVKELVAIMQKEIDDVVENIVDVTRQWSTVARTIVATESKDCLDLLLQLDGLCVLSRWLRDAKKLDNDKSDGAVDDSITDILQALEKLHVDNEMAVASGIWMTVKDLTELSNSVVKDRAKALFNSWRKDGDNDTVLEDVKEASVIVDDATGSSVKPPEDGEHLGSPHSSNPGGRESCSQSKHNAEEDTVPSKNSDARPSESGDDAQTSGRSLDHTGSPSSDPVKAGPHACPEDISSAENCSCTDSRQGNITVQMDNTNQESINEVTEIQKSGNLSDKAEPGNAYKLVVADAENNSFTELEPQKPSEVSDKDLPGETSTVNDVGTVVPDEKEKEGEKEMDGAGSSNNELGTKKDDESNLPDCSASQLNLNKLEESGAYISKAEVGTTNKVDEHESDQSEDDLASAYGFSKLKLDKKDSEVNDRKSKMEIDYGFVDPLDIARQVAIEVEREVVGCREQNSSYPEKGEEGTVQDPATPESSGEKCQGSPKEETAGENLSDEALPEGERPATTADIPDAEPKNSTQDMESSQVTDAAQELEASQQRGFCNFDLNQEVCSEELDRPGYPLSATISVSASRAAAVPGLPGAPLQFQGNLGWKGSAATSAFRPASPRRMPEGDKSLSAGGSSESSKERHGCLDIDLNVAESGDDRNADLLPGKRIPGVSAFASGESSVEASPRRSERLELDLNRASDDANVPSDWQTQAQLSQQRNGHHSGSPSSSSSSKQPSLRNFDLNDHPSFLNESSGHPYFSKPVHSMNSSVGAKSDDSMVSIMGMRVAVNRKDFVPQTISLPNGRTPEPDTNLGRAGGLLGLGAAVPYGHSLVYGYNGLTSGPAMPYSSTIYGPGGPIPYMTDSRGAPVVPQIMSSASALPPTFSHSPFNVSVSSMLGSNGAGPSRNNFDLNSGVILEGGNRDNGGLRQLFNPGLSRSLDEHLRPNLQPSSSSGVGGKRKEPDGGWDPYPFRNHQPPWK